ncbi:APC family permease [Halococcus sp. IIIV-5B]|uniref:APC family permease n=1 Tax=Halococcus sp. IIIV-5B TaxID=2321230 RepID=UPI000E73674F|nr:APC family permease [Halococcus sp. IIIV-5B]RJT07916.1 APC family permease [Halococcus sp. IIIV-5B]
MVDKPKLSWIGGLAVALGLNIGGALWTKPIVAGYLGGPIASLMIIVAVVPIILAAPTYILLTKVWPISPGHYYYPTRLLLPENQRISKLIGWVSIWVSIITASFVLLPVLMYAGASYLHALMPAVSSSTFSVLLIICTISVVWFGLRAVGIIEIVFAAALVVIVGIILSGGVINIRPENLSPIMPNSLVSTLSTVGILFTTIFSGLSLVDLSGDIENPEKVFGRLLVLSTGATAAISGLVALVGVGVVPYSELQGQTLRYVTSQFLPSSLLVLSTIGSLIAGITSGIAILTIIGRFVRATAEDNLLPGFMGEENRFGEPKYLLVLIGITSITTVVLDVPITLIVTGGSLASVGRIAIMCITGARLPSSRPDFFEKESVQNTSYLTPTIVRWTATGAAICLIAMWISLALQDFIGLLSYVIFAVIGISIYGYRWLQDKRDPQFDFYSNSNVSVSNRSD